MWDVLKLPERLKGIETPHYHGPGNRETSESVSTKGTTMTRIRSVGHEKRMGVAFPKRRSAHVRALAQ